MNRKAPHIDLQTMCGVLLLKFGCLHNIAVCAFHHCGKTKRLVHLAALEDIARKELDLVDELLDMGALLQLNADSILGTNGFGIKHFCYKLLREQKVHFVASDAHDTTHRPPLLRECFLKTHKKYGAEYAAALFYDNAQAVIENRIVE